MGYGEADVFRLFKKGSFDIISSDDRRFLNIMDALDVPYMTPSALRDCEKRGLEHFILHTGQHYSYNMDRVFFEWLGLPEAKYNMEAGAGAHGEQTDGG